MCKVKILKDYQGFKKDDICVIVYTKPISEDPNDGWHTAVIGNKSSVLDMAHENIFWEFIKTAVK